MSASVEISAGPYELINPVDKDDRITLCLCDDTQVSVRKYKGSSLVTTNAVVYPDLATALKELEEKIVYFKNLKYAFKEEESDRSSTLGKRTTAESPLLSLKLMVKLEPTSKRIKTDPPTAKSDQKSDKN